VKFKCPSCEMQLKAEPETAGKVVRCPGCNTKLQIPAIPASEGLPPPASGGLPTPSGFSASSHEADSHDHASHEEPAFEQARQQRGGWEETDPTNPNVWVGLAIGAVATAAWMGIMFAMPQGSYIRALFTERGWVNYMETFFFFWAIGIVYLKIGKLRHQKSALYLDVLPVELGNEVNSGNVAHFIDNLYALPGRLRDSMMVNRIRKGLELFEVRQNNGEVANMMSAQSDIDGARIGGSYSLLKVFLWAIPILGFIGTVLGLSQAIGGIDLSVMDVEKIMSSMGGVTSGLGTAFDTTLLGLVLAMILNFPINALAKAEDDNLNNIDAFCNEILMPRLNDGGGIAGGDSNGLMDSLVKAVANAQKDFLKDLNILSAKMNDYAMNLDRRIDSHQERVQKEFTDALMRMREDLTSAVKDSVKVTTDYTRGLASGIQSLNEVLKDLGAKQIVIHQVKKKGWFSRD
jgi:biopolymer transport protein ExbB/TolQ